MLFEKVMNSLELEVKTKTKNPKPLDEQFFCTSVGLPQSIVGIPEGFAIKTLGEGKFIFKDTRKRLLFGYF